eukprot:SAG31_NODE_6704_length_1917_cov_2.030803_3_plen_156_part_00
MCVGAVKSYDSAGVVTEAVAMARWLGEHGHVPTDSMLLEEEAVCTLTNALNAKRMLLSCKLLIETTRIVLVTSSCHMARAATCFCALFPTEQLQMAPAPDPNANYLAANLAREAEAMESWFPQRLYELRKLEPSLFLPPLEAQTIDGMTGKANSL